MVVIRGDAITAGSTCSFSATTGRMPPMSWLSRMVQIRVRHTTSATGAEMRSNSSSFAKLHTASVAPHIKATRLSRQRMRGRSWGLISPTAMPRMMVEVLWLPALPPASVSMGM